LGWPKLLEDPRPDATFLQAGYRVIRIPYFVQLDPPVIETRADVHLNGAASRSKEDPSYRQPLTNRRKIRFPAGFSAPERT
jgi:hypothetical protein